MKCYLKNEQIDQLLKGINPSRVGKDNAGFSHLEAWDVRAHLNRIFGFARWTADLQDIVLVYEEETKTKDGKPAYRVGYRATVRLGIYSPDGMPIATYTEAAFGESTMPAFKRGDAHDMAIKTAESQAFKRCAVNLGDQFGLGLYNNGSTGAVVRETMVRPVRLEEEVVAEVKPVRKSVKEMANADS